MNSYILICYLIPGLLIITLIGTLGAIASRKLNFNYAYLSILSAILYTAIAYLICKNSDLKIAIIINSFLALFDSTVGFLLSIKYKSNTSYTKEQSMKMIGIKTSVWMVSFALILTLVGYWITLI